MLSNQPSEKMTGGRRKVSTGGVPGPVVQGPRPSAGPPAWRPRARPREGLATQASPLRSASTTTPVSELGLGPGCIHTIPDQFGRGWNGRSQRRPPNGPQGPGEGAAAAPGGGKRQVRLALSAPGRRHHAPGSPRRPLRLLGPEQLLMLSQQGADRRGAGGRSGEGLAARVGTPGLEDLRLRWLQDRVSVVTTTKVHTSRG